MLKINKRIREILRDRGVEVNQAILYLLGVYYGINTTSISSHIKTSVNLCSIFQREEDVGEVIWLVPLFEGEEVNNWDWIAEWRMKFVQINSQRGSTVKECTRRMKKLFSHNPEIRKEDVLEATDRYLRTVDDATFLKTASYFIWKNDVNDSLLMEQIEIGKHTRQASIRSSQNYMM